MPRDHHSIAHRSEASTDAAAAPLQTQTAHRTLQEPQRNAVHEMNAQAPSNVHPLREVHCTSSQNDCPSSNSDAVARNPEISDSRVAEKSVFADRVRDVMLQNPLAVKENTPLSVVLDAMRRHGLRSVAVVREDFVMGMFTHQRLASHLSAHQGSFLDWPVSKVMAPLNRWVTQDMGLLEALHQLEQNAPWDLPVLDDRNALAGTLSLKRVLDHVDRERSLANVPLQTIMHRILLVTPEDMPLTSALAQMARHDTGCMLLLDNGCPKGILAQNDVAFLVQEGQSLAAMRLSQAVRRPVCMNGSQSLHAAAAAMRRYAAVEVVVVNEDCKVQGLVTLKDLARGLASNTIQGLERALAEKEQLLEKTMDRCDASSMLLDILLKNSLDVGIIVTDQNLVVQHFNNCAAEMTGYQPEETLGRSIAELHLREGVELERMHAILRRLQAGQSHTFEYQHPVAGAPHVFRARVAAVHDSNNNLLGYVQMIRDITAAQPAEDNIRFMAFHDMLTGLPNRPALEERFHLEASRAQRKHHKIGIMVVDMNNFKRINDTLGHFSGDQLLKQIALRLKSCLRKSDTVARIGGDEFVILLPEIRHKKDAALVAEKISQTMSIPHNVRGQTIQSSMSIGICMYPEHACSLEELLILADEVMYEAKKSSRNNDETRYFFAEPRCDSMERLCN